MTKREEQGEDLGQPQQQKEKEEKKKKKRTEEGEMKEMIKETMTAGTPKDQVGFHYFRLFSYLSMAILSAAILVGMFIIIQHIIEEQQEKNSLGRQETVIKNQELIIAASKNISESQKIASTILNETRRDNAAFFKILEDMTNNQTANFNYLAEQRMNQSVENGNKLDKIIEYLQIK